MSYPNSVWERWDSREEHWRGAQALNIIESFLGEMTSTPKPEQIHQEKGVCMCRYVSMGKGIIGIADKENRI